MVLSRVNEHRISVSKTARYFVSGKLSSDTKKIWIVIHGYGQLAGEFIKEFDFLHDGGSAVIAPEALSRFYVKNNVGASWMTKEDREIEIDDYIQYLESLLAKILEITKTANPEVNVLGFSQGLHTAVRWFAKSKYNIRKLVMCSSDLPKDCDYPAIKSKLGYAKLYYVWSTRDEFISESVFEAGKKMLSENGIPCEFIKFEGSHRINPEIILQIDSRK